MSFAAMSFDCLLIVAQSDLALALASSLPEECDANLKAL